MILEKQLLLPINLGRVMRSFLNVFEYYSTLLYVYMALEKNSVCLNIVKTIAHAVQGRKNSSPSQTDLFFF